MYQNTSPTPSRAGYWLIPRFGGPSVLEWQTFPTLPIPSPSSARVRILIAGISGADNFMRVGGYQRDPRTAKPGFTPGYDLVGVVEAIGQAEHEGTCRYEKDGDIQVGDTVVSMSVIGGYATHAVIPLDELVKIRADDDLVSTAALTLNYMTAYGMLTRSAFPVTTTTKSILIGAVSGGVGTALAQMAHLLFPNLKILGTCSPSKFAFVESLGVTPIDRTIASAHIPDKVRDLTDGDGVDIAYEVTGLEENMTAWLASTKGNTGKVIAIGFMGNIKADGTGLADVPAFDAVKFTATRADRMAWFSVTNQYWRGKREEFKNDFLNVVLEAVRAGKLSPVVGTLFRLDDAVRINEMLVTGQGVWGKLEMLVDEELWEKFGKRTTPSA